MPTASSATSPATSPDSASRSLAEPQVQYIDPPTSLQESIVASLMRLSLRMLFRNFVRPPFPVGMQRAMTHLLSVSMPGAAGVVVTKTRLDTPAGSIPMERIRARGREPHNALLYLHGGGFCVGSPRTHRAITTRLARLTGAEVVVPHYRRTPEHPFPAQVDDCLQAYRQLLAEGYPPERIALAGDSAGGTLSIQVPHAAALAGLPQPAGVVLMSPAVNLNGDSPSLTQRQDVEPMLHPAWIHVVMEWLKPDPRHPLCDPLQQDYSNFPPALVQVGEHEVLHDDAFLFARHAAAAGRSVRLERYNRRWHVFQIHAPLMPGAMDALKRQADFLRRVWGD